MQYKNLGKEIHISPEDTVSVKRMGQTVEICFLSNRALGSHIEKIDAKRYVDKETGEIKEFKQTEKMNGNRMASPESLRRTFRDIRELVQTYVTDAEKVRWCTVTYAENMTDKERLYQDMRKFIQRLRYYCDNRGYGKFKYICICEPQGRGAFHMHFFLIWDGIAPYISNDDFRNLWGYGFVTIKAIQNIDNIGGYFQAYLTDVEIPEDKVKFFDVGEVKETGEKRKKYYLKGGRLHMYPRYFNILRHSREMKKPEKIIMSYEEAMKEVAQKKLRYQTAFCLTNENGFKLVVAKEEYR